MKNYVRNIFKNKILGIHINFVSKVNKMCVINTSLILGILKINFKLEIKIKKDYNNILI